MSSPNNKSPANADGAADEKPRLTEEEKKQNHIASGMAVHIRDFERRIILPLPIAVR